MAWIPCPHQRAERSRFAPTRPTWRTRDPDPRCQRPRPDGRPAVTRPLVSRRPRRPSCRRRLLPDRPAAGARRGQRRPGGQWRQTRADRVAHEPVREPPAPTDAVQGLRPGWRGDRPRLERRRGRRGGHRRLDPGADHRTPDGRAAGARLLVCGLAARPRRDDDPGAGSRRARPRRGRLHALHLHGRHHRDLQRRHLWAFGRHERCRRDRRHRRRARHRCDPGQRRLDVGHHGPQHREPGHADPRPGLHRLPRPDHRRQRRREPRPVDRLGRHQRRLPVPDRPPRAGSQRVHPVRQHGRVPRSRRGDAAVPRPGRRREPALLGRGRRPPLQADGPALLRPARGRPAVVHRADAGRAHRELDHLPGHRRRP